MKLLLSTIGRRGYICEYFHEVDKDIILYGTSNSEFTSGFSSCDKRIIVPSINDEKYVDTLLAFCNSENITALLSFFDLDVFRLSAHKSKFETRGVKPFIPGFQVADLCFDKLKTHDFLISNGFKSPATFTSVDDCINSIRANTLNYPLILKPRSGFASKGIYKCNNEKELRFFSEYIGEEFIIQQLLDGEEHSFDILNDLGGTTVSVVVKRKLQMRSGETDMSVTVKNNRLLEEGIRLSETLRSVGPLDVDFFVTKADEIFILEINPRFGGGYPGSHLAGAAFPSKIISILKQEKIRSEIGNYKEGIYMMKDVRILEKKYGIDLNLNKA